MVSKERLVIIAAAAGLSGASLYVASLPPDLRTDREKLQDELLALGEMRPSRIIETPEEAKKVVEEVIGDTECQLLNREYQRALRSGRHSDAQLHLESARAKRCPWLTQL